MSTMYARSRREITPLGLMLQEMERGEESARWTAQQWAMLDKWLRSLTGSAQEKRVGHAIAKRRAKRTESPDWNYEQWRRNVITDNEPLFIGDRAKFDVDVVGDLTVERWLMRLDKRDLLRIEALSDLIASDPHFSAQTRRDAEAAFRDARGRGYLKPDDNDGWEDEIATSA